jgi:hypothetical protein
MFICDTILLNWKGCMRHLVVVPQSEAVFSIRTTFPLYSPIDTYSGNRNMNGTYL